MFVEKFIRKRLQTMSNNADVLDKPTKDRNNKRPDWLRVKLPSGEKFRDIADIIREKSLNTVCSEARCPNMGECWGAGTATFMILGDVCTRSCGFCAIKTGRPIKGLDWDEPRRVTQAASQMGLKHVVLTSVNRDERKDGGAPIFAETIRRLREEIPGVTIEVLIPDFRGIWDALQIVIDERPDVLNHNLETVPRLYRQVRPQAKYKRSLELLQRCKEQGLRTKTGIMVGLGETLEEVYQVMDDVVDIDLNVLTIGQYMQPTKMHLDVKEWVHPDIFAKYKEVGEAKGIEHVESGPLVRSSYHAERHV
ncbi:MAG TPA: lipoyl synthase [Balneolales bacterium]|nr:lipoyl synthase [Balneolales bacterium]